MTLLRLWVITTLILNNCTSKKESNNLSSDAGSNDGAWTAANENFMKHDLWKGGDQAASIELADGRILWVFGDTYLDLDGDGLRTKPNYEDRTGDLYYLNNTLAIQESNDPSTSELIPTFTSKIVWGVERYASYFDNPPENQKAYFWPAGTPVRLDDGLMIFLIKMGHGDGVEGSNFTTEGGEVRYAAQTNGAPETWNFKRITIEPKFGILPGTGSAFSHGDYIYLTPHKVPMPAGEANRQMYIVRYQKDQLKASLEKGIWPEGEWFYNGSYVSAAQISGEPSVIMDWGQAEVSIHYDAKRELFIEVQSDGLWSKGDICIRASKKPEGPWGDCEKVFFPPENKIYPDSIDGQAFNLYAGKAHPELRDPANPDHLIVTYVYNFRNYENQESYYPKFGRVDLSILDEQVESASESSGD